jgi:hypothetical protein
MAELGQIQAHTPQPAHRLLILAFSPSNSIAGQPNSTQIRQPSHLSFTLKAWGFWPLRLAVITQACLAMTTERPG